MNKLQKVKEALEEIRDTDEVHEVWFQQIAKEALAELNEVMENKQESDIEKMAQFLFKEFDERRDLQKWESWQERWENATNNTRSWYRAAAQAAINVIKD